MYSDQFIRVGFHLPQELSLFTEHRDNAMLALIIYGASGCLRFNVDLNHFFSHLTTKETLSRPTRIFTLIRASQSLYFLLNAEGQARKLRLPLLKS